eukprot:552405_1
MDDFFASKLTGGPLSGILNQYTSNKLLSKSRITKSDRDNFEQEQIQQKEQQILKNRKRKQIDTKNESSERIPSEPPSKKIKHSIHKSDTNSLNKTNNNSIKNKNTKPNTDTNANDSEIKDKIQLNLTSDQVITRLRELRQPIRYFGESNEERLKRLRRLEILEHERQTDSKGLKNISQSIKNEVEREIEDAMAESMNQIKKDGGNELDIHSKRQELKKKKYDEARPRSSFARSEDFVLFFFKRMLREWEQSLLNRSESEKISPKGKNATMLQKQARRDIRALFKQLKNRTVPQDVLHKSEKMVFAAEKRNYVEAKRIFFEMAIGNAPWPMGVTMVGIHERSGRSKIFSSQIAHVMNDEIQRKYIHAMARLISFAQSKYPSHDVTKNMG